MNHRHIQAFLTVSATFFAMNAPLAHAASPRAAEATARIVHCARAEVSATTAATATKSGRQSQSR